MKRMRALLPMLLLQSSLLVTASTVGAKPPVTAGKTKADAATKSTADAAAAAYAWRVRHSEYFKRDWGIDIIGVHLTESNWMLEFKYRITDAELARPLLAVGVKPYLVDQASGAKLAVPAMENVGELRQTAAAVVGRDYFILFGNASQIVKRGNLVDIEIGTFRAEGLPVE